MSQSVNLSVSGIYTALSDFNGLPPGALDVADNVECRYKNTIEPRRGFDELVDSAIGATHQKRLTNFYIAGVDRIIGLTADGDLNYYTGANPWPLLPGSSSVVSHIIPPNTIHAKSRFITAGQNLYVTAQDGVRSLSSGSSAVTLRAGVPKGLNLEAATTNDTDGFLNNNVVVSTTGTTTASSAILTALGDTTGIIIGQYVGGSDIASRLVVQDLTYTSLLFGVLGNAITIAYTTGGTAGAEIVTVVSNAINVQIQSGTSTATQVHAAILASGAASALVTSAITGTGASAQTAPVGPTHLAGGLDNSITPGTKVASITSEYPLIIETGSTTAGSSSITSVGSLTGIVAGVIVSGIGIPEGATVVSASGSTVVLDVACFQTATGVTITYTASMTITMDANALVDATGTPLTFYSGSQVGYRMVFGRVETDINNGSVTRLGAPSSLAIVTNTTIFSTNVTVTGTLPKNSSQELTFVQLYRSPQTQSVSISPLDQYNLVYERQLVSGDFVARVITITDDVPDSLVGIPLYTGSDREGILQANNPPPMCWDMCKFRDFTLFGNITRPTTVRFTIVSVGSPSGVQSGDVITVSGSFLSVPFTESYTASSSENAATRQFQVFSSGTPSQNIADTANSLIRVMNYDNLLPVHAILLSTATDLPGQILLEADNPSYDTFTTTASAHTAAYDPVLSNVVSNINTINNGIGVSKSGELEAVPATNLLNAGDTSSDLIRIIPLRDYVIVLKTDGIYKLQGLTPGGLVINPFDLTTKIIGADTAVSLNSGVWMLSNQGIVSISDSGVSAKSVPIDDQLNALIGSNLDNLVDIAFAVGYESDRKYILAVPTDSNPYCDVEYNYNYVTSSFTTWDRLLYAGFIHSNEGKMYISRADPDHEGVSKERKNGTYKDFVDESVPHTIVSIDEDVITLTDASDVVAGDVLFQSDTIFSPIVAVDLLNNTVTVQFAVSFVTGAVDVLTAYTCSMTWKQVFGDNPAFMRQFSEGLALFKNTRFNVATAGFVTDFSQNSSTVSLAGVGNGLWGLFGWGDLPWGGSTFPSNIRFLVPQEKQLGSYLIPSLTIHQGYSDFKFQGLAISYYNISQEVGL